MKNKKNHKHLLKQYSIVDEYLSKKDLDKNQLNEMVISFCTVAEKIIKIALHTKNPILVFSNKKFNTEDALIQIVKKEEKSIDTINVLMAIDRYNLIFLEKFTKEETEIFKNIYNLRNHFIHSHRPDNYYSYQEDEIITAMGTIWEKLSILCTSIFGTKLVTPKKPATTYTKADLHDVLKAEVKKKLNDPKYNYLSPRLKYRWPLYTSVFGKGQCPRCKEYNLEKEILSPISIPSPFTVSSMGVLIVSDSIQYQIYKCGDCSLELTELELEIAKEIIEESVADIIFNT